MIREQIEKAISADLGNTEFVVERPRSLEHGDYSTNAALVAKVDPKALAAKLKIEGVERVEVVGKFINFHLGREALVPKEQTLEQSYAGKTIMVEYTDPNPFKEFHIGHLMSNAIGESIARLLEISGATVIRANYQGDIGLHVGKAIWGKLQKPAVSWGEAYTYGAKEYENKKVEIDEINKKVYNKSDADINALYESGRKESLLQFETIYKTLGTKFDHYFFESVTGPRGLRVVKAHPEIFVESEGAVVYHGSHTRVFINSHGLPTYETKEVGLIELKQEIAPSNLYITVTAHEQNGFFEVVFEAIEKVLPVVKGKLIHRSHGMMRFAESKMSSRTGNVITGESLLADITRAARGREDVAVGAIKYAVLKSGSGKDIIFDQKKSLSLDGDSGPYLQYALVRARALLRKAKEAGIDPGEWNQDGRRSGPLGQVLPSPMVPLARVLVHYADAVARAAKELEPHYVTTYLTELAAAFNSWYAAEKVIGGQHQNYGVLLTDAVERTLAQGLHLLGIPAPEEM